MHFSSFHKYVRLDSLWANKYTTPQDDLKRGWDNKVGYFEEFSSIEINDNGFKKINSEYPQLNDIEINSPEKFGDYWDQNLKKSDFNIVKDYLNSIEKISKVSFKIKVGSKIVSSDSNFETTTKIKDRRDFGEHSSKFRRNFGEDGETL